MSKGNGTPRAETPRNRIIRHAEMSPRELAAHPLNWRAHPEHQRAAIAGAIDEIGITAEVTAYETPSGLVLTDGHLRVALAIERGWATIPVAITDLSEHEAKVDLLARDPIGQLATTNREALDELMRDAIPSDARLQSMISGLAEREGIIEPESKSPPDPGSPDEVQDLVNMINAEAEIRDTANRTAEQVIAHLTETIDRIAADTPDALNRAILIVAPIDGRRDVLILTDPGAHDIVTELRRRHDAGEVSPLDGLFASIWEAA